MGQTKAHWRDDNPRRFNTLAPMTTPINLRQVRKRKAREAKAKQAEANRVAHGTPKALKDLEAARREKLARTVEGHKRSDEGER